MPEQIRLPDDHDPSDAQTWYVIDANSSASKGEVGVKPRVHKLIVDEMQFDGTTLPKAKRFEFWQRTPTAVPRESAMRLLNRRVNNFEIYNETGLRCMLRRELLQSGAQIELGPTEVIADLTELRLSALRERCSKLPGGSEMMRKRPTEDDCITFILKGGDPMHGVHKVEDDISDDDVAHFAGPVAQRRRRPAAPVTPSDDDDSMFDPPAISDKALENLEDEAQAQADAAGADVQIASSKPVTPPKPTRGGRKPAQAATAPSLPAV